MYLTPLNLLSVHPNIRLSVRPFVHLSGKIIFVYTLDPKGPSTAAEGGSPRKELVFNNQIGTHKQET